MIGKLKQCCLLYFRDPGFTLLSIFGFLSLCAMQALVYWGIQRNLWTDRIVSVPAGENRYVEIFFNRYLVGDDLLTCIFILGSCVMFSFGLLIKKQFANDRASLLPGYRGPHIAVMLTIILLMIGTTMILTEGAMQISQIFFFNVLGAKISLGAIYLVIVLIGISMLYLGYLSMLHLVLIGYIALVVLAHNFFPVLQYFSTHALAFQTALVVTVTLMVFFVCRLFTLKSENMEYPFLLTWPPQKTLKNQLLITNKIEEFKSRFVKITDAPLPLYAGKKGIIARSAHWRQTEKTNITTFFFFWVIVMPLLYQFLRSQSADFLPSAVEDNFLLFAGTPALLTVITNYRNMMYWNYDLIKPVSREHFLKEQAVRVFCDVTLIWMFIVVFFSGSPLTQFRDPHSAAFLSLTLSFSWMTCAWLGVLSALKNERMVIFNGFILAVLILAEFFLGGRASTEWIGLNAVLCLIGSGLFCKIAFEKWMEKEF